MIDTYFSDLAECASMGARAFRTRRQLRRDARKDLPSAYAVTDRDVIVRLVAGVLLVIALGAFLNGCGGGDEADDTPAAPDVSDRPADAMCMWDPRANPVVYECNPGLPLPKTIPAEHR